MPKYRILKSRARSLLARLPAFFAEHRRALFPESTALAAVTVKRQRALATTSFLVRCTIRLVLRGGKTRTEVVRGNFLDQQRFALIRSLWSRRSRNLRSLEPLWYFPQTHYFLYREAAGDLLRAVPFRSARFSLSLRAAARALAAFHGIPPPRALPKRTLPQERRYLHRLARVVRVRAPSLASWAAETLKRIEKDEQRSWRSFSSRPCHGDFQGSNILVNRAGAVTLIDLSLAEAFTPAADVATFLAHLRIMLSDTLSEAASERCAALFLRTYRGAAAPPLRREVDRFLPLFLARACFDIIAVTVQNLSQSNRARQKYLRLLRALAGRALPIGYR